MKAHALKPGEICLYCGSVGKEPEKREPAQKPGCHYCQQPFTHKTPWRVYRGKRVHIACIPK